MNFNDIAFIFNRALYQTFIKKKLFLVFCVLALSGLLVVFFRGVALHAGQWVILSLTFLPIFLCAGILLSMGILLIRIYHDEIKKKEIHYSEIVSKSWEVVAGASYFAIPVILGYLLLWIVLGIFVMLREIPGLGAFFSVIFAFVPFLLNLGTIILCGLSLGLLFFVAPIIALKGLDRNLVSQSLVKRLQADPFSNGVLFLIALFPLCLILLMLTLSAFLTESLCWDCETPLQTVLKWFFIMLPFTAVLTPGVVFFFNFAAEAHVLVQKQPR
jgi:hypothetical protein